MGRQITIDQGTNTTDRTYSLAGQLLTESYTNGFLDGLTITNTYDSLLRRSHLETLSSSSQILTSTLYTYDNASRLSTVDNGTATATYSYLANSPLVEQIAFVHDGVTNMITAKSHDLLNRLTSITHEDSQPSTIASFDYGYNGANQRTNVTHANNSYWTYTYDYLGQVTGGKQRDDQDALLANRQFEYDNDDIGNRTARRFDGTTGGVLQTTNTYEANLLNQYTNLAGAISQYDDDGNLTNDTHWVYTWNGENRLVVLESSTNISAANRKKLEFSYDHQGRRASKTVSNWNTGTSSWDLGYQRIFVYDGWNLVAELDGGGNLGNTFVWGLDITGSLKGGGGVGGLIMMSDADSAHFVAQDGDGNVVGLVESILGNVTANYEYSPFGERLLATGSMASVNPFRFSTRYEDEESGFNYYGHRYYNSVNGRWLSRDVIEEIGGVNIYAFVDNSPVGYVDLFGLCNYPCKGPGEVRCDGWVNSVNIDSIKYISVLLGTTAPTFIDIVLKETWVPEGHSLPIMWFWREAWARYEMESLYERYRKMVITYKSEQLCYCIDYSKWWVETKSNTEVRTDPTGIRWREKFILEMFLYYHHLQPIRHPDVDLNNVWPGPPQKVIITPL